MLSLCFGFLASASCAEEGPAWSLGAGLSTMGANVEARYRLTPRIGLRGVMMPGHPGVEDYDSPVYDDFWRAAIDLAASSSRYTVAPAWDAQLAHWAEGQQQTLGAYDRPWR